MSTSQELFVNGELALRRKETHRKSNQTQPVFTSRMEKHEYNKVNYLHIRNALDIKRILFDIRENWDTYISKVHYWIQKNPVKKLVVTGIFTIVFGFLGNSADAAFIKEYTYQVKNGESIEKIALEHGVTAHEIVTANGISSIEGKKILLPKVNHRTVTATVLNIRSQPSTESKIIGKVKKDDIVKVAFVENGWAGILIEGRVCFVNEDYLTKKAAPSTTKQNTETSKPKGKTMVVTATSLRVRETASITSAIVGSLKANDRVNVESTSNGWAKIHFNRKTAFVSETFLTNIKLTETHSDNNINTSSSVYVIKAGDTFTKISNRLGVPVQALIELNLTVDPNKMKIGQKIKIPIKTSAETDSLNVTAQIISIDPQGTFRFTTSNGGTFTAIASLNQLHELLERKGEKVTLTLKGKRGQQMTLLSLH